MTNKRLKSIAKKLSDTHNVVLYANYIKVDSNTMKNHRTIIPSKTSDGYTINVTLGSIDNPNPTRAFNGTWYNLGNKEYTEQEILEEFKSY